MSIRIALLDLGPACFGKRGLKRHDFLRRSSGILPADQRQELLGVSTIGLTLTGEAVLQIIVTVGQAEAALAQIDGVDLGVFEVAVDARAERRGIKIRRARAHQSGDPGQVGGTADRVEFRGNCVSAEVVYRRFIHE